MHSKPNIEDCPCRHCFGWYLPLPSATSSADQGHVQSTFLTPRMPSVPRRAPVTDHYLHVYLSVVYLLGYRFYDPDDNVLQAFSLRVVVQDKPFALLGVGAPKGRRPHTRVDGRKVVVQGIEVLQGRGQGDE